MLSGDAEIYGLLKWYPTTILPVLYAATAVGLARFSPSRARLLTIWLLTASLLGTYLLSPLPGGRAYEPQLYEVTAHDRQALEIIAMLPQEAGVAAFPHYVPHLAHRENVYHFPWIKIGRENVDYFLFDCESTCYPLSKDEYTVELTNLLVDPAYALAAQTDDIYLFKKAGDRQPAFRIGQSAEEAYQLSGFDLAVENDNGIYRDLSEIPAAIENGRKLKVILYWEALKSAEKERTVSVRLVDNAGNLAAQHDGQPGEGSRPTSWWQTGQKVRDIHTLALSPDLLPGNYSLELLLYDSFTQERVPFDGGVETIKLGDINIRNTAAQGEN